MKVQNKETGHIVEVYGAEDREYYFVGPNGGYDKTYGPMFLVWAYGWQWQPASHFRPVEETI